MEGAIDLVLRVMSKTMDSTTLGSEKRKLITSNTVVNVLLTAVCS